MDRLNRWLSVATNIGVLIGIVFLAVEVQQNSEYMALQLEFGQPTQKIFEINRDLQNPELARTFAKAIQTPADLTFEEGLVASSLVLNLLNEWEDRYLIHAAGLSNVVDWRRHIEENITWTLGSPFAIEVYKANREAFEDEFVGFVDGLLPQIREDSTYLWWTDMKAQFQSTSSTAE